MADDDDEYVNAAEQMKDSIKSAAGTLAASMGAVIAGAAVESLVSTYLTTNYHRKDLTGDKSWKPTDDEANADKVEANGAQSSANGANDNVNVQEGEVNASNTEVEANNNNAGALTTGATAVETESGALETGTKAMKIN